MVHQSPRRIIKNRSARSSGKTLLLQKRTVHNKHIPASGGKMWAGEDQRAWCAQVGGGLQERQGRSEAGGDLRELRLNIAAYCHGPWNHENSGNSPPQVWFMNKNEILKSGNEVKWTDRGRIVELKWKDRKLPKWYLMKSWNQGTKWNEHKGDILWWNKLQLQNTQKFWSEVKTIKWNGMTWNGPKLAPVIVIEFVRFHFLF